MSSAPARNWVRVANAVSSSRPLLAYEDVDLLPDGASSLLQVFQLGIDVRTIGVHQHSEQRGVRNEFA